MKSVKPFKMLMFAPFFSPFINPESIVDSNLASAFMKEGRHIDVISRHQPVMHGYSYGSDWDDTWVSLKEVTSIGSFFYAGTEYDRGKLCAKEKEVPYVVPGCGRDRMGRKE